MPRGGGGGGVEGGGLLISFFFIVTLSRFSLNWTHIEDLTRVVIL